MYGHRKIPVIKYGYSKLSRRRGLKKDLKGFKMSIAPKYLKLLETGEFAGRVMEANLRLFKCAICPHKCGVNRKNEHGFCKTGILARVNSHFAHPGEEKILSGTNGSGTVFFSGCNMRCAYCQNFEISQGGGGYETRPETLARMMIKLQSEGCHNINFVSPSHVIPQIVEAVFHAAKSGLKIPIVYNSGGYDSKDGLELLDGIVDIYMPDMKYGDDESAFKYSGVKDYVKYNREAVTEMHGQAGDLVVGRDGIARSGLIVRHLVLPGGLAGTENIVKFLAGNISKNASVNIMAQYWPAHKASEYPELSDKLKNSDYEAALKMVGKYGLAVN